MFRNKNFFGSQFEGSEVDFPGAHIPKWTLTKKLIERNRQLDEYYHGRYKSPSAAWALFDCVPVGSNGSNGSSHKAIMKIYMQFVSPVFVQQLTKD